MTEATYLRKHWIAALLTVSEGYFMIPMTGRMVAGRHGTRRVAEINIWFTRKQ